MADKLDLLEKRQRIVIGYSGGLDSAVLLHACANYFPAKQLLVVHVDHGLSPLSREWARFSKAQVANLGLDYRTEALKTDELAAPNLEQQARNKRFACFDKYLSTGDVLCLAHHQNDQAETFLFRALRGAGLDGLSAIRPIAQRKGYLIVRPFLDLKRAELETYARAQNIAYINDESNADTRFDRNYLRHRVLPVLQARWPRASQKLAQASAHLQDSQALLTRYLREDLKNLDLRDERIGQSLSLKSFNHYGRSTRQHLLRLWLTDQGYLAPSLDFIEEFERFIQAKSDSQTLLQQKDCQLRRYRDRLYSLPQNHLKQLKQPQKDKLVLELGQAVVFGSHQLLPIQAMAGGLNSTLTYDVGSRDLPGRSTPIERHHSQTLKKLLQEYELEPWLREFIPVLRCQGEIAAVGDLWVDQAFFDKTPKALSLKWQFFDTPK